jgi:hypothetical protein
MKKTEKEQQRLKFIDYVYSFYGAGEIYADMFENHGGLPKDVILQYVNNFIEWRGSKFHGDTIDREMFRDVCFELLDYCKHPGLEWEYDARQFIACMTNKNKNGHHTNKYGDKFCFLNGKFHCTTGPAIEFIDGTKFWFLHGKLHRTDGPAKEYANGTKVWYLNAKRHRLDGPTVEYSDGTTRWHRNDQCLGNDVKGFWAHWGLLTHEQRCNLNLHKWLVKYT